MEHESSAPGEFATLPELAAELGLTAESLPAVRRTFVRTAGEQGLSGLAWGDAEPEVVFLHGGGQNAHTWDAVILHLGHPALAIDLPGHGHSSWRADRDYRPAPNAVAVAQAIAALAPRARLVVGMSLGGLTTIRLMAGFPELVRAAMVIDASPRPISGLAAMQPEDRGATALITGSRRFDSLEQMVGAAVALSPRRSTAAVERGVRHNAVQDPDGSWRWRYDVLDIVTGHATSDSTALWGDLEDSTAPVTLVRGGASAFVSEKQVREFLMRRPDARVEVVARAGHSVQSDEPQALAMLIEKALASK